MLQTSCFLPFLPAHCGEKGGMIKTGEASKHVPFPHNIRKKDKGGTKEGSWSRASWLLPERVAKAEWRWSTEVFRWLGTRHDYNNQFDRTSPKSLTALMSGLKSLHIGRQLALRIYILVSPDLCQLEQKSGYLAYIIHTIPSGLQCW